MEFGECQEDGGSGKYDQWLYFYNQLMWQMETLTGLQQDAVRGQFRVVLIAEGNGHGDSHLENVLKIRKDRLIFDDYSSAILHAPHEAVAGSRGSETDVLEKLK